MELCVRYYAIAFVDGGRSLNQRGFTTLFMAKRWADRQPGHHRILDRKGVTVEATDEIGKQQCQNKP